MKTPEEMAEEYCENHDECEFGRDAFLAGYQAAKDTFLAQFKSLLSSYAETSFNPNHTAWQIFDTLKGTQAAKNSPEKPDTCEHILDMEKMVDVNSSNNSNCWISVKERLPDVGQRVLIYNPLEYVSIVMANYYNTNRPFFDHITLDDIHLSIYPDEDKQLYWMPLSKLPEVAHD